MAIRVSFRTILGLAVLVMAGALLTAIVFHRGGDAPEKEDEPAPSESDLALETVNYTETRDGVPIWSLQAESASHDLEAGLTRIENIRMVFHDVPELGEVILTARDGEMRQNPKTILLEGNVAAENGSGFAFYSDRVRIDPTRRRIHTEKPVRILYKKMEIRGRGMNLDVDERKLSVLSQVETRIAPAAVR